MFENYLRAIELVVEQLAGLDAHVRRLLIEAAWHYRHRPRVGATVRRRRQGQPAWAMTLADKAHARLHRCYWGLVAKGKPPVVAT